MIQFLVKHLIQNNMDEIVAKSLINCHCEGVHSIMLLDCPEKTIRLFISSPDNVLWKNYPTAFPKGEMSIAFHPHHCNVTLHCVFGNMFHWEVAEVTNDDDLKKNNFIVSKYKYSSQITKGNIAFEKIQDVALLETKDADRMLAGATKYLTSKQIHTVACEPDNWSAWFVYEGKEDADYVPICYSNSNPNNADSSKLYQKAAKGDILYLLKKVRLYGN